MLSKGLEKVVSNILDVKHDKQEFRYLYNDTKALVATDGRRILILNTVLSSDIECLLMVKKVSTSTYTPNTIVEGYPAITDAVSYPDYERIIPNKKDRTVLDISYGSDDCNELICFIARLGLTFNVKFIQDLFVNKVNFIITKLIYDKDDINNPFMLEGNIDGYDFKYIVSPIRL
jgi:hypothetical protein